MNRGTYDNNGGKFGSIMNSSIEEGSFDYLYLGNIPTDFRSTNLRYFFSKYVENKCFICFHYKHRPEQRVNKKKKGEKCDDFSQFCTVTKEQNKSCCCIIKCSSNFSIELIRQYHGTPWCYSPSNFSIMKVHLQFLKITSSTITVAAEEQHYQTKKELLKRNFSNDKILSSEDLFNLSEINPPIDLMPNGNVGTPTEYFKNLIRTCQLPCRLIEKINLVFPASLKKGIYSAQQFDYDLINNKSNDQSNILLSGGSAFQNRNIDKDGKNDDSADSTEEWDRHIAIHHDSFDNQTKEERLFEEDVELKWEKGGSGLVFYTDAYFWNQIKGKDFDEDTVDDWDVDYSIYEKNADDENQKDQPYNNRKKGLSRRKWQRKRSEKGQIGDRFAEFENHTKGIGSRLMYKQGWKKGGGLGSSEQGIQEPLLIDGQSAKSHFGLGYYGEKLDRTVSLKRIVEKDVYISTKYDHDRSRMKAMVDDASALKYRDLK